MKAREYSAPVPGLIFLLFAEARFTYKREKLEQTGSGSRRGSRVDDPDAYHAEGILYLPECEHIGAKVNDAMREIEKHNTQLAAT